MDASQCGYCGKVSELGNGVCAVCRAGNVARDWVRDLDAKTARYGSYAVSPYVAADLCGYCAGFGDGAERGAFLRAFTIAREESERLGGAAECTRVPRRPMPTLPR